MTARLRLASRPARTPASAPLVAARGRALALRLALPALLIALLVAPLAAAVLGLTGCAGGGTLGGRETTPTAGKPAAEDPADKAPEGWGERQTWLLAAESGVDTSTFSAEVDNPYWPLAPGTTWTYRATTPDGTETIEVEVLAERRLVMGVECAVVRDTVSLEGELVEDTRDWYAQDATGNVWYMGEEVDNYENGKLTDNKGSWEAGVDGALPGIKMWAEPRIGQAPYYQEFYEGEAEDLARDLLADAGAATPFDGFEDLLLVEEWTPLDPDIVERKYYARGVGTVKEEMVRGGEEVVLLTGFEAP